MKNINLILIGLEAMRIFGSLSREEYEKKINDLCNEYGTEVVAATMVRLGHC